jgi:hypothetical protein
MSTRMEVVIVVVAMEVVGAMRLVTVSVVVRGAQGGCKWRESAAVETVVELEHVTFLNM